jgi:hypothetical protein
MMTNMFDFNSSIHHDSKGNMVTPSFRVPDSLVGFALSDDGGFSQTMNGHRQEHQGPTRKQHPSTEPVDVEAITFQILSELDDDLFDYIVPPPAPQVVDSGCYDPISVSDSSSRSGGVLLTPTNTTTPKKRLGEKQGIVSPRSSKKQRCISPSSETSSSDDPISNSRFRGYQADQWTEKFEELCAFIKTTGHCQVPHGYPTNESLARWTKRQRYQYKLRLEGKPCTMTEDRIGALNALGFVWNSHEAIWEERWTELEEFKLANGGHCNVPSQFETNQKLATWVKCQRRQYKLFLAQQPSNMTPNRAARLHELGFVWELRSHGTRS